MGYDTTWLTSPEDGVAYPAPTPTDAARMRSVGYVDCEAPAGAVAETTGDAQPAAPEQPVRQDQPRAGSYRRAGEPPSTAGEETA